MRCMRINRYVYLIMEYIEGMTVYEMIKVRRKKLTEYEIGIIMQQLLMAVYH